MNYFELHVGDYEAATAHLSMLEDSAYGRMLRIYYRTERPLPADVKQVCRLVRAQSKPERDAVQAVLEEFFELQADGWHQGRADAEIQQFRDGEPEREARKSNEEARLKRHREERAALFKALNDAGQHAPWNTGMQDLRSLVKALQRPAATPPETATPPSPATAPATSATATQTPLPNTQYPENKEITSLPKREPEELGQPLRGDGHGETLEPEGRPTPYGAITQALRKAGIQRCNPGHLTFRALVDAGATADEFLAYVDGALEKRDPFAYLLAVVESARREAKEVGDAVHRGSMAPPNPAAWRDTDLGVRAMAAQLGMTPKSTELPHEWVARVSHTWQRKGCPALLQPTETA